MIEINKIPYNLPKNTFKVIHEWMIGDADGTEYTQQFISKDNKYLEKYLECWTKLIKPLPGKIGNILKENTILKILGEEDAKWFNSLYYDWDNDAEDDIQELYEDCFFRTETDLGFYSYRGFVISYFDENGLEYGVKYTS